MTVLSNINDSNQANYFKELPFYNKPIEKPKIKRLKNINLLTEQPFYEHLSKIKTNQAFSGYAMSYKVEIVETEDLILQFEPSELSIKDLFSDLLNETKGCKYQITVNVLFKNISPMEKLNFLLFILIL